MEMWSWVGGPQVGNAPGDWGSQGVPSTSISPSARRASAYWKDKEGNFWLFGGLGIDSTGTLGKVSKEII